jgi:hypothetical protein
MREDSIKNYISSLDSSLHNCHLKFYKQNKSATDTDDNGRFI